MFLHPTTKVKFSSSKYCTNVLVSHDQKHYSIRFIDSVMKLGLES